MLRQHRTLAIDRRTGRKHQPFHLRITRSQQHIEGAVDINIVAGLGIRHRTRHTTQRRQMIHHIRPSHTALHHCLIAYITFDKFDPVGDFGKVLMLARLEIVKDANGLALIEQKTRHITANKSRSTGNQR